MNLVKGLGPASRKRFPFLDWMRGVAVLIMIQCHVFNYFTLTDQRKSGLYIF